MSNDPEELVWYIVSILLLFILMRTLAHGTGLL